MKNDDFPVPYIYIDYRVEVYLPGGMFMTISSWEFRKQNNIEIVQLCGKKPDANNMINNASCWELSLIHSDDMIWNIHEEIHAVGFPNIFRIAQDG